VPESAPPIAFTEVCAGEIKARGFSWLPYQVVNRQLYLVSEMGTQVRSLTDFRLESELLWQGEFWQVGRFEAIGFEEQSGDILVFNSYVPADILRPFRFRPKVKDLRRYTDALVFFGSDKRWCLPGREQVELVEREFTGKSVVLDWPKAPTSGMCPCILVGDDIAVAFWTDHGAISPDYGIQMRGSACTPRGPVFVADLTVQNPTFAPLEAADNFLRETECSYFSPRLERDTLILNSKGREQFTALILPLAPGSGDKQARRLEGEVHLRNTRDGLIYLLCSHRNGTRAYTLTTLEGFSPGPEDICPVAPKGVEEFPLFRMDSKTLFLRRTFEADGTTKGVCYYSQGGRPSAAFDIPYSAADPRCSYVNGYLVFCTHRDPSVRWSPEIVTVYDAGSEALPSGYLEEAFNGQVR